MKLQSGERQFELPTDLREKLQAFRRRVWSVKFGEGVGVAWTTLLLSYLAVFGFDRLGDTGPLLRTILLAFGAAGLFIYLPWKAYRWIWQQRHLTQLARLLSRSQPRVGDRLLGVIELVETKGDKNASPALCRAAIQQVADDTRAIDFLPCVPAPRHKRWLSIAAGMSAVAVAALLVPGAGWNALLRWAQPWAPIARYTFTQLQNVPEAQVVPQGEPFRLEVKLSDSSLWSPTRGSARYARQTAVEGAQNDGVYAFEIPAQTEPGVLSLAIGDARPKIRIEPKPRPELTNLVAKISLPDYLQASPVQRDARSGVVSVVRGSQAKVSATASRDLAQATVNGQTNGLQITGPQLEAPSVLIQEEQAQEIQWTDVDGLSAKSPFRLKLRAVDDRAPHVQCNQLSAEQVILDEQVLAFEVESSDDFGIKTIGVEWTGIEDPRRQPQPPHGEYLLANGAPNANALSVKGDFSARRLGISPQPIHLRIFVEDYLPGRPRVYSPVYRLYVLDREQHMIWVTQQLEQWERQALEVRDQEARLLATNEELLKLSPEEFDRESTRQQLARQAAAERANAQRLSGLTQSGDKLINEAARNPEFNVESLERWAQVLSVLKQLSQKDMPSVADQLTSAANAPGATSKSGPSVSSGTPSPGNSASQSKPKPSTAPSVSDSVRAAATDKPPEPNSPPSSPSSPSPGSLQLPSTTLPGGAPPKKSPDSNAPANQQTQQAVEDQQKLLDEFNRVMGEMAKLLQDLQGSTFVKRLKAAADSELSMASDLHGNLGAQFGEEADALTEDKLKDLERLQAKHGDTTNEVRLIQEDLAAYFERTKRENFRQVFDEMRETQIVQEFKQISTDVTRNQAGEVIAQAEFWSDKLDRWAEMLVGPGCANQGKCPGGKGDSLPPSIVLEVLRILKSEVELRDSTRVVEQQRPAVDESQHLEATGTLKGQQQQLTQRTDRVIELLQELQSKEKKNYGEALKRLGVARKAMQDATDLLAATESGAPTIAAETEAIEALLITKRGKPGGGGGGGASPGGSESKGAANEASALAGIGELPMSEAREVSQATGEVRGDIPEEFRSGLDAYFSQIEGQDGG